MSVIYIAKCTLNNMVYIGKHDKPSIEKRIEQHHRDAGQEPDSFHQELQRQGLVNWKWDILAECDESEVFEIEEQWINKFKVDGLHLLNTVHNRKRKKPKPISHFRKQSLAQKTWKSGDALRWMYADGKLLPCKNKSTGKWFRSLIEAGKRDKVSRASIKRSCETGYLALNECQYVYTDLEQNELPTPGHEHNSTSRFKKSYSQIKHLASGKTYETIEEAANAFGLKKKNVQAVCGNQYKSTKGHSFCYIDRRGEDVIKNKHEQFLQELAEKNRYCLAVYELDDVDFKHPQLFKNSAEIAAALKISQAHIPAAIMGERSHVNGYRIAKYEKHTNTPFLTKTHKAPPKKVIRAVICLNDQKKFSSCAEAGRFYGASSGQVRLCCEGRLKTTSNSQGYKFRFAYLDDNGNPRLTETHLKSAETLDWKGTAVYCPEFEMPFRSIAAFLREAKKRGVNIPQGRAVRHLDDPDVFLAGLHLFRIENSK